jgi:hypothetical protein
MRALSPPGIAQLLVTVLIALTLTSCAASSRPAPAACTPASLRVSAEYIQGGTQHAFYGLRFTNVSRTACTLTGYARVSLVTAGNSSGHPIGSPRPADMPGPGPMKTVTLAPGQRALAALGIAETVMFTGHRCHPVAAHWLKVYPPHLRHARYLPTRVITCSAPADQVLEISPVAQAGSAGWPGARSAS